ncbi:shikimate kinase [Virgibacillus subterraneus]|uniref:Shikimate kinase n=2 Tax=Virgibacillus TaxID=84406 RepID=A0A1H1BF84_9BACI|nr:MULTISPECIES: shikimate kinase [Virgibacillus]SDQ50635.1 shikimate kinase [Virgibacillus salinus]SEQ19654.1 shikimate kinase [Virgibacillus subterraneus]
MKTLYLIGFMGSGKSTIGEMLSSSLRVSHIDTDHMVEEVYGQTIAAIFQNNGEGTFRMYESEVLKNTPLQNCVISTGGGIVEKGENVLFMKENGVVVYLETSFDEIAKRLEDDQTRPLWSNNVQEKKDLFIHRKKLYEKDADIIVHTDNKTAIEITEEVKALLI